MGTASMSSQIMGLKEPPQKLESAIEGPHRSLATPTDVAETTRSETGTVRLILLLPTTTYKYELPHPFHPDSLDLFGWLI